MNNNNNKDTTKVKYLTLTRLKAEYSNLLIIIVGCAALNQQLPWEHARDVTLKYQEKAGKISARGGRSGSLLHAACVTVTLHYEISLSMPHTKIMTETIQEYTPKPKYSSNRDLLKNHLEYSHNGEEVYLSGCFLFLKHSFIEA